MNNEKLAGSDYLYTLMPLEDFKEVLGIDDREEKFARFCLLTATFTIEQYCKRRLLRKKQFEVVEYYGDLLLTLKEYPVSEILAVYTLGTRGQGLGNWEILEPDYFEVIPDCGEEYHLPFMLSLSPAVARLGCRFIKIIYNAGYSADEVPPDLSAACLELASWNMNRYRGRRVGLTGNVRGSGKEGEHFEMSMPENVQGLLEPYKRKTI